MLHNPRVSVSVLTSSKYYTHAGVDALICNTGPSIKDVCTLVGGGQAKVEKCRQGEEGWLAKCWLLLGKKNYSYHICEIYSDNLAVCLYIKFSFCFYSIENVWNGM